MDGNKQRDTRSLQHLFILLTLAAGMLITGGVALAGITARSPLESSVADQIELALPLDPQQKMSPQVICGSDPLTYTGTIEPSDTKQTGRLVRTGQLSTCNAPGKPCPGPNDATVRSYDVYTFTNSSGIDSCITVNLSSACGTNLFSATYLANYDPNSLCTNFLADAGASRTSQRYSFNVPAGADFVVVVHETTAGQNCGYTLTVGSCDNPPPTSVSCGVTANYTYTQQMGAALVPASSDIGNHGDDALTAINLPFPVQIYGQTYTSALASANGTLQFGSPTSGAGDYGCLYNANVGTTIFPFGANQRTDGAGAGIFTSTIGTPGNRQFIVEWRTCMRPFSPPAANVPCTGTNFNYELIFNEASPSTFSTIYGSIPVTDTGQSAVVGVQNNDSSLFTQYECGTAGTITNTLKIDFFQPACPATATPTSTSTSTATNTGTATNSPTKTNTSIPSATSTTTATATACPIQFQDVPSDYTFYPFVRCLACRNILGGYQCGGEEEPCGTSGDPYFRPSVQISRGQIAKIVSQSANLNDPPGTRIFEDVPEGSPFFDYIQRLTNEGHMGGYGCGQITEEPCIAPGNRPYFRPSSDATRGQLSKIVANAAGIDDPASGQTYEDVPGEAPFYLWIERLTDLSVMSGYPCGGPGETCGASNRPYFRPNADVTRGQAAKIVANTFFPNCQTPARR